MNALRSIVGVFVLVIILLICFLIGKDAMEYYGVKLEANPPK